jgi:hypothetical protein
MGSIRAIRVRALLLLLVSGLLSAGCYVEQRGDGKWWVCDTVQTSNGPIDACQPLDISIY